MVLLNRRLVSWVDLKPLPGLNTCGDCERVRPWIKNGTLEFMPHPAPRHATVDEWVAREAIPFGLDSAGRFDAAVDQMMALLGGSVELLGFGEALHGGEEIL